MNKEEEKQFNKIIYIPDLVFPYTVEEKLTIDQDKNKRQVLKEWIDKNYISKEEVKEKIEKIQRDCNNSVGIIDGNTALHQLKEQLGL